MDYIAKLVDGIIHYQHQHYGENAELARELRSGQNPKALLIGCSDSRVDPALLTNCSPGDLFMVRNVANLVPPYEQSAGYHGVSSALEYAVTVLEVANIIILGHSGCGGIAGLMQTARGSEVGEFVGKWVNIAASARDKVLTELADRPAEEQARACEKESILVSLANLMTFPWIGQRVEQQTLNLHGWYFNIGTGQMKFYNRESGQFEVLVERYRSKNIRPAT